MNAREFFIYAREVVKGRFEKGEEAISKDPYYTYWYAQDVIKGRFEKGEEAISKDPYYAYLYAQGVLRKIKLTDKEKFILMFLFPDLIRRKL